MEHFERQIVAWLGILLGAWFLARAAQTKREKLAMKELLGVQVDKVKVFRNFFMQRLEAIVGFSFVLFGVGTHIYVIVRHRANIQRLLAGTEPRLASLTKPSFDPSSPGSSR